MHRFPGARHAAAVCPWNLRQDSKGCRGTWERAGGIQRMAASMQAPISSYSPTHLTRAQRRLTDPHSPTSPAPAQPPSHPALARPTPLPHSCAHAPPPPHSPTHTHTHPPHLRRVLPALVPPPCPPTLTYPPVLTHPRSRTSSALSRAPGSIRMSSGPLRKKLKPRSAVSICGRARATPMRASPPRRDHRRRVPACHCEHRGSARCGQATSREEQGRLHGNPHLCALRHLCAVVYTHVQQR